MTRGVRGGARDGEGNVVHVQGRDHARVAYLVVVPAGCIIDGTPPQVITPISCGASIPRILRVRCQVCFKVRELEIAGPKTGSGRLNFRGGVHHCKKEKKKSAVGASLT